MCCTCTMPSLAYHIIIICISLCIQYIKFFVKFINKSCTSCNNKKEYCEGSSAAFNIYDIQYNVKVKNENQHLYLFVTATPIFASHYPLTPGPVSQNRKLTSKQYIYCDGFVRQKSGDLFLLTKITSCFLNEPAILYSTVGVRLILFQ
jgi:hypothetical protein